MSVSQFYRFILIVFVSDDKKPLATAYPEPQNDPPHAVEGDGEAEESGDDQHPHRFVSLLRENSH